MVNAVVSDYGDEIAMDLGEDITGWTVLLVSIQRPDGTVLAKVNGANGVTDKAQPTAGIVYYKVESNVRTTDGEYRYTAQAFLPTKIVSSLAWGSDIVGRINQTVSEG